MAEEDKARKKAVGAASAAIFDDLRNEVELNLPEPTSPWSYDAGKLTFEPDWSSFQRLIALPIRQGAGSNTGRLGKVIDAWAAHELRRAGFGHDEVWPRATDPRIWPSEYSRLLDKSTRAERGAIESAIGRAGLSQSTVLGRHFFKQIDVLISTWDRGPELMVSTKAQMSSFGNNLNNRFEEFVGDAHNLKGRFPLAATAVIFVVRSTVDEGDQLARVVDMLRKLRDPVLYDATCLISISYSDDVHTGWPDPLDVVGGWPPEAPTPTRTDDFYPAMLESLEDAVSLVPSQVPDDLSAGRAFADIVDAVLERTPVSEHLEVRRRRHDSYLPPEEIEPSSTP